MIPVYREQIGQMVASFGFAELTSEPELTEIAEGLSVYVANAALQFPAGRPINVTIFPLAEGFELPYRKGDMCRVVYNHGEAVVVAHAVSSSEHGGNTVLRPREGASVVLGSGSAEPEAVALHARIAAEIVELKAQVGVLAAHIGALEAIAEIAPNAASDILGRDLAIGPITGGEAALGVKGRPS